MDLNSSNVFLKHEDEKKYLEKNNITYKKLGNNSTIIGFPHDVKDTNDSFIQFIFNSGSSNDPLGKKGLHHLYEHLILNRIHKNPKSVDVYKNGSTTHRCLKIDIQGVSNPNVKEYGIYPIIPDVISILKNPLDTITKDNIENEVKIAQIAQKEKLIQKAVPMSPKNRYSIFTLGIDYYNRIIDADLVKKEYEKITVNEINEWKERLLGFNPSIIISGDLTAS